ncbi:MAG: hypothetical protein L3J33_02995 [Rhodobacteraceae bacterium]|nr:hypothetical protein [Paracoccaceae bacterium]
MNTYLKHVALLSTFFAGFAGSALASPSMPAIFLAAADQAAAPLYGYEVEVTCATCHVGGDTLSLDFEPGYPTFLKAYYNGTTLTPATDFDDSLTGVHAIEFDYAPSIASANRMQTIPGDQALLDIAILPGLDFDQSPASNDTSSLARITGI